MHKLCVADADGISADKVTMLSKLAKLSDVLMVQAPNVSMFNPRPDHYDQHASAK